MFTVDSSEDKQILELIISKGKDLSERKQLLIENSNALIVLPGGVGTFDELWHCVCGKSLTLHGLEMVPICVLNTDGFYDGSIQQLQRAHEGLSSFFCSLPTFDNVFVYIYVCMCECIYFYIVCFCV